MTFHLLVCRTFIRLVQVKNPQLVGYFFFLLPTSQVELISQWLTRLSLKMNFSIYIFTFEIVNTTFGITYKLFVFHLINYISKTYIDIYKNKIKVICLYLIINILKIQHRNNFNLMYIFFTFFDTLISIQWGDICRAPFQNCRNMLIDLSTEISK